MSADRTVEHGSGDEAGASGDAQTAPLPPDATDDASDDATDVTDEVADDSSDDATDVTDEVADDSSDDATDDASDVTWAEDPGRMATRSGAYPRPDGTAAPPVVGGDTAASDADDGAPAGDDREPGRLVGEPVTYRSRWNDIQAAFVDDPRRSVADADALVGEVIDEITAALARSRADLEQQWSRGEDVSTEDLRQAFRRYRSFFQHLLTT